MQRKTMKITSRILIVLFVSLTSSVGAEGLNFGLVKEGSFLLSRLPDKPKDGFRVHSLVGYLPVGTRVLIGTRKEVRNIKTSEKEIYYYVKSDIGVHGLLKEDLLIQSEGDKLAVSIASFAIPVHQPHGRQRLHGACCIRDGSFYAFDRLARQSVCTPDRRLWL